MPYEALVLLRFLVGRVCLRRRAHTRVSAAIQKGYDCTTGKRPHSRRDLKWRHAFVVFTAYVGIGAGGNQCVPTTPAIRIVGVRRERRGVHPPRSSFAFGSAPAFSNTPIYGRICVGRG